ncbi:MAG: glycosyltransferase [Bacteroidia bacterium]
MKSGSHLVFVTPGFARDEQDSTCTPYLQSFFLALKAARPDLRLTIIAMQYPYFRGKYKWHGLDVIAVGGKNRRLRKPMVWRRTRRAIVKLHRRQPIDVVHSFWLTEATNVAAKACKRLGIKHVASCMGQDVLPTNAYLKKLPFGRMHLIALSAFNAGLMKQHVGREADAVIPFGLADGDVDYNASSNRPIDLLAVGSLVPVKRYDRFLRVVKMASEVYPGLRAMLIGDGEGRKQLERQAAEFGLEGILEFAGQMSRDKVLKMMSSSKVFVHTSDMEGTGLVLVEALGRGMHVVTSPVGVGGELMEGPAADKCAVSMATFTLHEAAVAFLNQPVDWQPRLPYPMDRCVAEHLVVYAR